MGELCPVGSCTKQLRSCIGFQYWYVPYIPVPYTGSTSSIGILYQNAVLWVIIYVQVRFSVSSLYASPDDLTTFCHRMEQIQTQLGPIERKNGTNRLRLPLVSPIQIWVIIYVQTPVFIVLYKYMYSRYVRARRRGARSAYSRRRGHCGTQTEVSTLPVCAGAVQRGTATVLPYCAMMETLPVLG